MTTMLTTSQALDVLAAHYQATIQRMAAQVVAQSRTPAQRAAARAVAVRDCPLLYSREGQLQVLLLSPSGPAVEAAYATSPLPVERALPLMAAEVVRRDLRAAIRESLAVDAHTASRAA